MQAIAEREGYGELDAAGAERAAKGCANIPLIHAILEHICGEERKKVSKLKHRAAAEAELKLKLTGHTLSAPPPAEAAVEGGSA